MKTRIISMLLAAAMMFGLLAGCGNTNAPETTPPTTTVPATDPASGTAGTRRNFPTWRPCTIRALRS